MLVQMGCPWWLIDFIKHQGRVLLYYSGNKHAAAPAPSNKAINR